MCINFIIVIADVNECESNPCLNNGGCIDSINGYICNCKDGYSGDICESGECLL